MNIPEITEIVDIKTETKDIKTITFEFKHQVEPGQFLMIWIPKIDEIPMSVSEIKKDQKSITFRIVGDATKALYNLKIKDKIGIRGPYGNGFKIKGKNNLYVGGGTGISTLAPVVESSVKKGIKNTIILGAKTKNELFFERKYEDLGAKIIITTDDGSKGFKGHATDKVKEILKKNKYDQIMTCGPEMMMKQILDLCGKTPLQASLERYMKCAIGICGQCCIGEGLRVCKEGPVFDGKTLKTIEDFGVYRRDSAGRKIRF